MCAVAPNFSTLLVGRMIQAIGAGIIMPLLMTVVMFIFPIEKKGSMMGVNWASNDLCPSDCTDIAGFIIDYYSWRWLFIGLIPFVVIVILLAINI